jgi:hypothetical protein
VNKWEHNKRGVNNKQLSVDKPVWEDKQVELHVWGEQQVVEVQKVNTGDTNYNHTLWEQRV